VSNFCVFFYDAMHPVISHRGVVVALCCLIVCGLAIMCSIYLEMVDLTDAILPLGGFDMNAKGLVFNAFQNMVIMWTLQLVQRYRFPDSLKMLSSGVELRSVKPSTFEVMKACGKRVHKVVIDEVEDSSQV
jgi:hypothetical protein